MSFQFFTSMTFVAWNLSSSQIALKGLQKIEVIGFHFNELDVKKSGVGFFWNIKPNAFSRGNFKTLAFIVFFLSPMK